MREHAMILTDNRNVLRMKDRELLNKISEWDHQQPTGQVIVEQAKTGVPTMKVIQDGKTQYLQSKYDPEKEAQRFAGKFAEEPIHYVLFVGVGTAYHIEAFMKDHPDAKFAIYEPNEEVLHAYLSNFRLDKLPVRNLLKIFTGIDQGQVAVEVQQLLAQSNNVLKIITLPVYEKMYGEQVNGILEKALEAIKNKHSSLATNVAFQKRWTINSIKNFPTVLQTPNILHDIDRSAFEGKPAIIVAAGPSLNEEFENLRYIKEHGLAYIFSVGSAINALIEQGIYPDAACTYDPQDINYRVIQVIKDKGITEIPLVFGSSVGFETLENYPGDLLHMIVNQDTVAPAFLESEDDISLDYVNDAPSIAVITFQLLAKLRVNQIILVGQNLAYVGNQHYAKGIDYGSGSNTIAEDKLKTMPLVNDVYGNEVRTTESFTSMRKQLEMYISLYPQIKVWNTTKGGATILGSEFSPLEEVMQNELKISVVEKNWPQLLKRKNTFNLNREISEIEKQAIILQSTINKAFSTVRSINQEVLYKRTNQLENKYNLLDSEMNKVRMNTFYNIFIEPMIRVQQERLSGRVQQVKYENSALKKAEILVEEFTLFIAECAKDYNLSMQLFKEMKERIEFNSNRK